MMIRGIFGAAILLAAFNASAGVAGASPYCYDTGPGYEKCVDGSTDGFFHPIYQGPQVPDGSVPWINPSPPAAPVIIPQEVVPPAPNIGDECIHAQANTTTTTAVGVLRCVSIPQAGWQWQPDNGPVVDPAIAGQLAWSDCIASHTAAECRKIVDGSP